MRTSSIVLGLVGCCFLLASASGAPSLFAQSASEDRVVQPVDGSSIFRLRGSLHPLARAANDRGALDPSEKLPRLTLTFRQTAAQKAELETLLARQQDKSSPDYHRWLSPEEFGRRFGLSQGDLDKITAYLEQQGFQVVDTPPTRTWIRFSGTAGQVQSAFHAGMHRFAANGETHYANSEEPAVPAALADVIAGVSLNDFRPQARSSLQSRFTSGISGNHFLTPSDFATIYDFNPLYSSGINGSGQTIAVVGQSAIQVSDIEAFEAAAGLPVKDPVQKTVPNLPVPQVLNGGDAQEASLDLEWSGAVARGATILYVYSQNVFDALSYAVSQNLAPVISISYGDCEHHFTASDVSFFVSVGQQANAQGITVLGPSGDAGAADCDSGSIATQGLAVDLPASLPYVTGVGGTEFNDVPASSYWAPAINGQDAVSSALSYIPEVAWNDTAERAASGTPALLATGGGASTLFGKPGWQMGSGVPNDGARDVPDIAVSAPPDHDGYLICTLGSCVKGFRDGSNNLTVYGGTSFGPPTFAGVMALINQETGTRQGNANYTLYALASHSLDAFHDISSGNNMVPCQAGTADCPNGGTIGYPAGAGYDQTTGLGTIDANNLVTEWTSVSTTNPSSSDGGSADFQLVISPERLAVPRGTSGSAQIAVTPLNGFSGMVSFACTVSADLSALGTTCTVTPGQSSTSATLKITAPSASAVPRTPNPWGPIAPVSIVFGAGLLIFLSALRYATGGCPRPAGTAAGTLEWAARAGLVLALAAYAGCGGSASNQSPSGNNQGTFKPTTSSVVVQGSNGTTTHTAQISVTVN
jgi:subtilase family serine protease